MWHSFSEEKLLTILNTDSVNGINQEQVSILAEKYGLNVLPKADGFIFLERVTRLLKSPLSLVLIVAGIATIALGEYLDSIVIGFALLINLTVGLLQEGKASRVFDTLEKSQEKYTTVIRNGKQRVLPSSELVPGDIVALAGGSSVPADIRLLEANSLAVDESSLTGEWIPVDKIAQPFGRALPLGEQKNMVWMGTLLSQGSGLGVVVDTGSNARFGQVAKATNESGITATPLQKSIRRIARFLILVIGAALIGILVLGLLRGEPLTSMLLLSIAIAVAAMPAGLPAAVTIVLAIGMESILKKGGLVKNLLAAETLGSTTIILTDKTGTLTQGRMIMRGLYTSLGIDSNDITAVSDNKELLRMAVLSSDAFVEEDKDEAGKLQVHGRPIEKAIVEAGLTAGLSQSDLFLNGYHRLDFLQFEPTRRYAVSLNECPERGNRVYISGSPEHVLALSSKYFTDNSEKELTKEVRDKFSKLQSEISASGMRFTAVAYVKTNGDSVPENVKNPEEGDFVFVGLLAFSDAVRPDVKDAIQIAKEAGARVVMVTGDYPETARAIAFEVGIDNRDNAPVLTGATIEKLSDEQLLKALTEHNIVARVLPEQKLRVTRLLRNSGEVVAMTGDGVNDAPALAAADIGIAVGSGTEVAKAASDLILIDNSFSVITAAIAEGRRIVANLKKIVTYLLSTSFSEIIVIGGSFAFGAPLPLLPTQILWANIIEEGFMSFPFAFEPAEKGSMKKKPAKRGIGSVLTGKVRWFIFLVSAITGLFLLGLFFLLLWGGVPIEKVRTIMFAALSIDSMLYAFSFKDLSKPIWRIPLLSNLYLIAALFASFGLLLITLTFGPLKKLLSLTSLSVNEIFILVLLGLLNLVVVEIAKVFLNRK